MPGSRRRGTVNTHLYISDLINYRSYRTTLLLLLLVRLACLMSAWLGCLPATLALAATQFIIAPYSLFASATLALVMVPPIYGCHYIAYSIIQVHLFRNFLMKLALLQNVTSDCCCLPAAPRPPYIID